MTVEIVSRPPLPDHWRWAQLGEVCSVVKGEAITRKEVTDGPYPVIAGGQTPSIYHNQYNYDGETITVSASGAYAGFVAYHERPIFASDCSVIKPLREDAATRFIYCALKAKQDAIYKLQLGAAQPHVYPRDLVKIPIPLPPIEEQRRIVARLDERMAVAERARVAADRIAEAANALKNSLLREILP